MMAVIPGDAVGGDYDNDDYLDLFVDNASGYNFLYRNNGDGTFIKITIGDIVNEGGSYGSSWGDFDNDGDLDLFVINIGAPFFPSPNNTLYANNGNGTFTKIKKGLVINASTSISCSWGDYNNDSHLDLFIAAGAFGENNLLFQNNGDGTFTKVTEGDIVKDDFRARGCSWADFDNDGNLDLFVANRNGHNLLYRNNGEGSFAKIIQDPVVNDSSRSYSGSWGDFDNDGDLDLFVANFGDNNFLYANNGDGTFIKVTEGGIVNDPPSNSFGSSWGDFDNDGDLDLFVANYGGNNFLYANNGDGTFTKITEGVIVTELGASTACAWGDYDRDGDLDMFVANDNNENNFLYANNGNDNHWINIKCVGMISNRSAIGARVKVKAIIHGRPVWQMQEISAQTGFGAQNSLNTEFGLGDAALIDSLLVVWSASGIIDVFTNIAADQFLAVTEGQGIVSVKEKTVLPKKFELRQNYPNPFNPVTSISYSIARAGYITLKVYNLYGREVKTLVNGFQSAGTRTVHFDAKELSTGIYFYKLHAGNFVETKKMLLLR